MLIKVLYLNMLTRKTLSISYFYKQIGRYVERNKEEWNVFFFKLRITLTMTMLYFCFTPLNLKTLKKRYMHAKSAIPYNILHFDEK